MADPTRPGVPDIARAVIFGRDAPAYESARPGYPEPVLAHVKGLADPRNALEVGAGTGKATVGIANRSLHLICLEPSPQMADVLRKKELPGVEVLVSRFEDWEGEPGSQDLIYAAQAWHWVDRATGMSRAFDLLRPGGVLALFWNIPLDRYARHEQAYRQYAPHLLEERDQRIKRRDDHDWLDDMAAAGFTSLDRLTHHWSEGVPAKRYRALYSTYSDHMMLDEPVRTALLDHLAADVESWGGTALVEYRTEVFSGIRPDPARG